MTGPATTDAEDPLKALFSVHAAMARTFPVPDARVMFVQVNKNACTSLKWMMAGLAGEDPDAFAPGLRPFMNDEDAIHERGRWRKTPRLNELTPEQRSEIHPDNGWFVFAVTRDPRSRLFSAWQSKLLLQDPGYTSFRKEAWYPRHPLTAQTVVEDFAKFVDLFEREPDCGIRNDGHFRDQTKMLYLDTVTYTQIYDITEIGRLRADLQKHLDSIGWSGTLSLPKFNDTPLRANARPFADGVRERIEKIYAADFERFGDRWDFSRVESAPDWSEADLSEAELRAAFGRRIGDLRNQALKYRARATAQQERAAAEKARADAQKARADKQQARADALQRRVTALSAPARRRPDVGARLRRFARAARRELRRG